MLNVIERGGVIPYVDIINRLKFGYFKYKLSGLENRKRKERTHYRIKGDTINYSVNAKNKKQNI